MLGIRKKVSANQTGELTLINSLDSKSAKVTPELLDKGLKCMNALLDVAAAHSYRNVIIDQVCVDSLRPTTSCS